MFVLIELWSMSQCPCGEQLQLNYIKILPCIFKTHIKKKGTVVNNLIIKHAYNLKMSWRRGKKHKIVSHIIF